MGQEFTNMNDDIQEIKKENKKLRRELNCLYPRWYSYDKLEEENKKLKEQVQGLEECLDHRQEEQEYH